MANRYSKAKTQRKETGRSEYVKYDEQRRRLSASAKVIAIVISLAMIVTAFISAGVFFMD